jgi:serine/threonine protein phosphatase PrpC
LALRIGAVGKTDKGLVRNINEDAYLIDLESNLFVVCDGMGGHQAGEVASGNACEVIGHCFSDMAPDVADDKLLAIPASLPTMGELLIKAIRLANRSIYRLSRSRSDLSGMGTTVVGAVLQDNLINIAHVGDSRAYRVTKTGLIPLTTDHSWISELKQSGQFSNLEAAQVIGKNVITRALGVSERVEVDFRADRVQAGDIYILCTDGLCAYAEDNEIFEVIKGCLDNMNQIVDNLIQLANDRGGQDNVTVIAINIENAADGQTFAAVTPVTVSVEGDESLLRENQMLETMFTGREKAQEILNESTRRGRGFPLIFIFIFFIIIASIVIYIGARQ